MGTQVTLSCLYLPAGFRRLEDTDAVLRQPQPLHDRWQEITAFAIVIELTLPEKDYESRVRVVPAEGAGAPCAELVVSRGP